VVCRVRCVVCGECVRNVGVQAGAGRQVVVMENAVKLCVTFLLPCCIDEMLLC
jgi:hypothetical protein